MLVDVKGQGFVYNPVGDELTLIRDFPDKVRFCSRNLFFFFTCYLVIFIFRT